MLKTAYRKLNDTTILLIRFTKLHSLTDIHNYENAIIYILRTVPCLRKQSKCHAKVLKTYSSEYSTVK